MLNIKRTPPSLVKKTKRIGMWVGRGDNMNKITSSENIFPFFPFLARKKKLGGEKMNLLQNIYSCITRIIAIISNAAIDTQFFV